MRAKLLGAATLISVSIVPIATTAADIPICLMYCPAVDGCELSISESECTCKCSALTPQGAVSSAIEGGLDPTFEIGLSREKNAWIFTPKGPASQSTPTPPQINTFHSDPTGEAGVDLNTAEDRRHRQEVWEHYMDSIGID